MLGPERGTGSFQKLNSSSSWFLRESSIFPLLFLYSINFYRNDKQQRRNIRSICLKAPLKRCCARKYENCKPSPHTLPDSAWVCSWLRWEPDILLDISTSVLEQTGRRGRTELISAVKHNLVYFVISLKTIWSVVANTEYCFNLCM